jgi:hypothetical protein
MTSNSGLRLTDTSCYFTIFVTCNKVVSVATNPIPPAYIYTIDPNNLVTVKWNLPTYTVTPTNCPFTPMFKIFQTNLTTLEPVWMDTNTTSVFLGTTDFTLDGLSYALTVQAYDIYGSTVNISTTITFKLMFATSIAVATKPSTPQTYSISQPQLSIPVPTYTWFPT